MPGANTPNCPVPSFILLLDWLILRRNMKPTVKPNFELASPPSREVDQTSTMNNGSVLLFAYARHIEGLQDSELGEL